MRRVYPVAARGATLLATAFLAAAGCTTTEPADTSPYAAEFEEARQRVANPEVRDALADGHITDSEVERGKQIALDCFADKGMAASYDVDGNLSVPHPDGFSQSQVDEVVSACAGISFDLLHSLKEQMESNPQNIPREKAVLDCFKRFGLVEQTMTTEQLWPLDWDDPPWPIEEGDTWGCFDDPISYQGGRPDLSPDEARQLRSINGESTE